MAANNSYVWVSDNANNKVHVYNASTMQQVATWSILAPGAMTLDSTNNVLWVVENAGNNASSSIHGFDATVPGTATAKWGVVACGTGQHTGAPNALAIDSSHRLVVADNGVFPQTISDGAAAPFVMYPKPDVGQVEVYTTGGANPVYSYTFGASVFSGSTPGKVTAQGFHGITSLAFDGSGNFYVACAGDPHDVGTGTYLRKFNSDATSATQTWQITGLQFVGGGSLDPANLNQFYSSYSGYSFNWANNPLTGTGTGIAATWNMDLFNPGLYPTDKTTTDLCSDWLLPGNAGDNAPLDENHPMVFEVRDIQGKPYLFTDAMNMGNMLGVMRMNGNVAVPAVLFGYAREGWPADATKAKVFTWTDANGDGCMQAGEFTVNANPIANMTLCGKWIDDNANIWTCNRLASGSGVGEINEIKLQSTPLNSYGVPQYNMTAPVNTWVAGTNNVTTDTDWTGLVEVAYLPATDTMIVAGQYHRAHLRRDERVRGRARLQQLVDGQRDEQGRACVGGRRHVMEGTLRRGQLRFRQPGREQRQRDQRLRDRIRRLPGEVHARWGLADRPERRGQSDQRARALRRQLRRLLGKRPDQQSHVLSVGSFHPPAQWNVQGGGSQQRPRDGDDGHEQRIGRDAANLHRRLNPEMDGHEPGQ